MRALWGRLKEYLFGRQIEATENRRTFAGLIAWIVTAMNVLELLRAITNGSYALGWITPILMGASMALLALYAAGRSEERSHIYLLASLGAFALNAVICVISALANQLFQYSILFIISLCYLIAPLVFVCFAIIQVMTGKSFGDVVRWGFAAVIALALFLELIVMQLQDAFTASAVYTDGFVDVMKQLLTFSAYLLCWIWLPLPEWRFDQEAFKQSVETFKQKHLMPPPPHARTEGTAPDAAEAPSAEANELNEASSQPAWTQSGDERSWDPLTNDSSVSEPANPYAAGYDSKIVEDGNEATEGSDETAKNGDETIDDGTVNQ